MEEKSGYRKRFLFRLENALERYILIVQTEILIQTEKDITFTRT